MDTIFSNSENSKTSDTHRLLFKLSGIRVGMLLYQI